MHANRDDRMKRGFAEARKHPGLKCEAAKDGWSIVLDVRNVDAMPPGLRDAVNATIHAFVTSGDGLDPPPGTN